MHAAKLMPQLSLSHNAYSASIDAACAHVGVVDVEVAGVVVVDVVRLVVVQSP